MSNLTKIAIIDLGTSSLRLDIFDISNPNLPVEVRRARFMPRLGEGAFNGQKQLVSEAYKRTLNCFIELKAVCEEEQVEKILAVGTSILRDVANGDSLISEIHKCTGIELKTITGTEEAFLISRAFLFFEQTPNGSYLLVDIGGGSTEFNIGMGSEIITARSLDIGSARLHQMFLKSNPPIQHSTAKLREHVRNVLEEFDLKKLPRIEQMFGTSGTIRTLAELPQTDPSSRTKIDIKFLRKLNSQMETMTLAELINIPKMDERRADLILAGSLSLEEIMNYFDVSNVKTSIYSLRHGLLAEYLRETSR